MNTTLMAAPTQVLHSSNREASRTQLTARSVLFSCLSGGNVDNFFRNPPPAQEPESLCDDSQADDSAGDCVDVVDGGSSNTTTCGRLIAPRTNVKVAATSGWCRADDMCEPTPGPSSPTLLVADSDEET
ncbi:unnamed protein product [Hydatigera taeniaeformis]|uniref:Uncharacterized protein n=1 Tax=Hydatigena taeniaeformis TaxID=6205 RepID=A0A3P7GGL4_HYDTA|nr:unnamed protein product [Hydatigera taeniaeformis]